MKFRPSLQQHILWLADDEQLSFGSDELEAFDSLHEADDAGASAQRRIDRTASAEEPQGDDRTLLVPFLCIQNGTRK